MLQNKGGLFAAEAAPARLRYTLYMVIDGDKT